MKRNQRTEIEKTKWPVDRLKPHPKQSAHFNNLSRAKLEDLIKDIDLNGLREPLEVVPGGGAQAVVVSGHQRLRATRELQWREVDVIVRHDLAAQGEEAIEHRLIECNLNRRHLSKLEFARSYKRLKELSNGEECRRGGGDLRDQIGKRLGISGRTLDRLLPLLDLPREIQQAVDERKIPVNSATNLAKLPEAAQAKVVDAIVYGKNLRMTVFRVLHEHGLVGRKDATPEQLKALLRSLLLQGKRLAVERKRLRPMVREDQIPTLHELADFVLSLCPANGKPTSNGKPREKKARAKPRPR